MSGRAGGAVFAGRRMATVEKAAWLQTMLGVQLKPAGAAAPGAARDDDAPSGGDGSATGFFGDALTMVTKLFAPKKPVPRADLGPTQQTRSDKLLGEMSPEDKAKVQKLLDDAKGDEKKYLTKALASKHSAADLEAFAEKIKGKDQKWRDENLHLVGLAKGKGIKQQWHDSCAPTTMQAMMGELDPIYALKLHEENKNLTKADDDSPTAINPKMAAEQKAILESHEGVAKPRAEDKAEGGEGMRLSGALNETSDTTGLKFDTTPVSEDEDLGKGLDSASAALKGGLPVPCRVSSDGGDGGHAVLLTGVDPGPPRRFSFHDPWEGETVVFTEDQIKKHEIDIAGWSKLTHIYLPSAK